MVMSKKIKLSPSILVTIASLCLMSGLYVLSGGEIKHEEARTDYVNN